MRLVLSDRQPHPPAPRQLVSVSGATQVIRVRCTDTLGVNHLAPS